MNMRESDNIASLVKSILSILLTALILYLLFWKGWIWGILLVILLLGVGFAIYFWVKMHKMTASQEKRGTVRDDPPKRPAEAARDEDALIIDDGKIQVTDLSGAKEVDFEKE